MEDIFYIIDRAQVHLAKCCKSMLGEMAFPSRIFPLTYMFLLNAVFCAG